MPSKLLHIPAKVHSSQVVAPASSYLPLVFCADFKRLHTSEGHPYADVDDRISQIIRTLLSDTRIRLQTFCNPNSIKRDDPTRQNKFLKHPKFHKSATEVSLCVNIYGPPSLYEDVGSYMSKCKLFLQDPVNCDQNLEYRNPHRMPFPDGQVVFTQSMHDIYLTVPEEVIEEVAAPADFLRGIELQEKLEESETPDALLTELFPYVKYL